MQPFFDFSILTGLQKLPAKVGIIVILTSCLVMLSWALDIDPVKSISAGWPQMLPNTAICFLLSGISLLILSLDIVGRARRLPAHICAGIVIVIATITLSVYILGWPTGIDSLFLSDKAQTQSWGGHISLNGAISFLLIGGALLSLDKEWGDGQLPAQYMALCVGAISLPTLLGYSYGSAPTYNPVGYSGMGFHTALIFLLLAVGILCARPDRGVMAVISSKTAGGKMARRMVLVAILAPAILGWVKLVGERFGQYETAYGTALLMAAIITVFLIFVWHNADLLHKIDLKRQRAEDELRETNLNLEEEVNLRIDELEWKNSELKRESNARELAMDRLRHSREELTDLFENAPVGIHMVGPDGVIRRANKVEFEMLGYSPDEYVGHHIAEFHADPEVAETMLAQLSQGEEVENQKARMTARDGSIKHVLISSNVLWRNGKFIHSRCFTRDNTERQLAEEKLRESEARFRTMADTAPVLIWIAGTDKLCSYFNKGWLEFTGREIEQELGNGWLEGVHPEDFQRYLETYITSFDARKEFSMEYRLRRHDGEYRWVLEKGVPLFLTDGTFNGYIGSCLDITERQQAEADLRESENLKQAVLDALPEQLAVLDRRGNIMAVNQAWTRFAHQSGHDQPASIGVGVNYLEVCRKKHGKDIEQARQVRNGIIAVLKGEQNFFSIEYPNDSPGVSPVERRWFLMNVVPLRGPRGGAVIAHIDVTKRRTIEEERSKLLEAEKRARARAEEAGKLKDEFLAIVSHELRTPLNTMLGWTRLLRDGNLDEEAATRALETIERNARAQEHIIGDLLDVSVIMAGNLRLNIASVEPAHLIEDVIEAIRPAAEVRKVTIQKELDYHAGPVSGDFDRLHQVIWNLLSNAIKFTDAGGMVRVKLERVGSFIEINVSDNGIGIKQEFLPSIFEKFRQADSSSRRLQGGLGLGLSIVREVVEMHGGTVLAESPGEGQGATFVVRLPLRADPNGSQSTSRQSPYLATSLAPFLEETPWLDSTPHLDGLKVLVVDNDADTRALVTTILRNCDAEVRISESVGDALQMFDDWGPDLLVSDIEMPGSDGYELISKLREMEVGRKKKIPAVALTAYTRSEDRMRALAAGFQIHVAKPVQAEELLTIIASLSGRLNYKRMKD